MKPDEFEKQLANQPLRPVPSAWRAEILEAARAASSLSTKAVPDPGLNLQNGSGAGSISIWWRELLWPCPQAWAGLAAVWMLIFGLHATRPSTATSFAGTSPVTPQESATALSSQRRELARLLDNFPETPPTPKPAPPGPRSERLSPPRV